WWTTTWEAWTPTRSPSAETGGGGAAAGRAREGACPARVHLLRARRAGMLEPRVVSGRRTPSSESDETLPDRDRGRHRLGKDVGGAADLRVAARGVGRVPGLRRV